MADQPLFFDNAPFLGRIEEQSRFREALRQVMRDNSFTARAKDWVSTQDPPPPFVFLLYGEGGMGKSTLAKQLRHIATTEAEFKGHFESLWLDWEARKQIDLKLVARDNVSPETVFEHIYAICRDADFGKEFNDYEAALTTRAEAEKKVAQALDATVGEGRDRYGAVRELGAKGLAWLLRTGLPGGANLPQEQTAKAFEAIIGGGAEGIARARDAANTLLRSKLKPDEFDLFTLPNETLARTLANGLWKAAQKKPILLTLDTYEIADRADMWLRVVIKRAGPNVIWVIAGRDNLAASRKYGQSYQQGYQADFTGDRLRVFSMNEFSVSDVTEYFKYRVPERPLDEATVQAIHQAALGIPLAVKEAAAIWQKPTATLSDITGDGAPSRDRDKIVQTMTERFLLHCWDDPHDRQRLYALALAYQPDADLLSAMLDTQDLEAELSELERRHSFVFVTDMKLHDKVSVWIREYLQAEVRRKSKDVRDLHQRAVKHLRERLAQQETLLPLLEDRVADESWTAATTALTYHAFWLDEMQGWQVMLPAFVGGLGYFAEDLIHALVDASKPLVNTFTTAGKRRLKTLEAGLDWRSTSEQNATLLTELESSQSIWPADGRETERRAILDLRRGQLLFQGDKYTEALNHFERVETRFANLGETLKNHLGRAFLNLFYYYIQQTSEGQTSAVYSAEAKHIRPKVVAWLSDKAEAWRSLGDALNSARLHEEAIAAYQRAIELSEIPPSGSDPKVAAAAHNGLGIVYHHLGHTEQALVEYRKGIELEPNEVRLHESLGRIYFDLGRTDEGIAEFQRAIELDPKNANLHRNFGASYNRLGRTDEAIAEFQRAIELAPNDANLHNRLAYVYDTLGRIDDALAEFRRAIELDPTQAYLHSSLANQYARLGRTDEAIAAYQRAIELDPKYARSHNGLGNVYRDLGRTDEAIAAYQRAIELNPKVAQPYIGLGRMYMNLGRTDEAIAAYQRAIELSEGLSSEDNPRVVIVAHNSLGHVYADLGRTNEAVAAYKRAIELDPKFALPHNGLGFVYADLGRTDEALAAFQRAIELDPKNAVARASLVVCLRELGREAETIEHEQIARELIAKEDEYSRACFEAVCGNVDEALALLKVALEKKQEGVEWARQDPDFDSLRSDPRFIALVGAADDKPKMDV